MLGKPTITSKKCSMTVHYEKNSIKQRSRERWLWDMTNGTYQMSNILLDEQKDIKCMREHFLKIFTWAVNCMSAGQSEGRGSV